MIETIVLQKVLLQILRIIYYSSCKYIYRLCKNRIQYYTAYKNKYNLRVKSEGCKTYYIPTLSTIYLQPVQNTIRKHNILPLSDVILFPKIYILLSLSGTFFSVCSYFCISFILTLNERVKFALKYLVCLRVCI